MLLNVLVAYSFLLLVVLHCMDVQQFLNPSSVDRHLDCFLFGVIINKAGTHICLQFFIRKHIFIFIRKIPRVGLLGCIINVCLTLEETTILLSKMALQLCIQQCMGFPIALYPRQNLALSAFFLFNFSHSSRYIVNTLLKLAFTQ